MVNWDVVKGEVLAFVIAMTPEWYGVNGNYKDWLAFNCFGSFQEKENYRLTSTN